jgi:phosphoesterase RecJ-like protein
LRLAAELVEAGADVHGIFRHVYETVQFAKLKLLARALDRAQLYEGGRLLISFLLRSDFRDAGAVEPYSEGIIDYLRQAEGAELVALIREPPTDGGPTHRVSLRSSKDEVDVSAIARQRGGGGHRQAAGFSSEQPVEQIVAFIRRAFVDSTSDEGEDAAASA